MNLHPPHPRAVLDSVGFSLAGSPCRWREDYIMAPNSITLSADSRESSIDKSYCKPTKSRSTLPAANILCRNRWLRLPRLLRASLRSLQVSQTIASHDT